MSVANTTDLSKVAASVIHIAKEMDKLALRIDEAMARLRALEKQGKP